MTVKAGIGLAVGEHPPAGTPENAEVDLTPDDDDERIGVYPVPDEAIEGYGTPSYGEPRPFADLDVRVVEVVTTREKAAPAWEGGTVSVASSTTAPAGVTYPTLLVGANPARRSLMLVNYGRAAGGAATDYVTILSGLRPSSGGFRLVVGAPPLVLPTWAAIFAVALDGTTQDVGWLGLLEDG